MDNNENKLDDNANVIGAGLFTGLTIGLWPGVPWYIGLTAGIAICFILNSLLTNRASTASAKALNQAASQEDAENREQEV